MSTLGESESQTCSWYNLSCARCIKVMSHRDRASSLPSHTYKAFPYVMSFLHLFYGSSVREVYHIAKFLVHFSEVLVLPAHALQQANSLPTFVITLQVDKTSRRDTIVAMKHAIVLLLALLMVLIYKLLRSCGFLQTGSILLFQQLCWCASSSEDCGSTHDATRGMNGGSTVVFAFPWLFCQCMIHMIPWFSQVHLWYHKLCVCVFGRCWTCSCCSQITQIYPLSMTAEWCSRNSDNAVFQCYWCS